MKRIYQTALFVCTFAFVGCETNIYENDIYGGGDYISPGDASYGEDTPQEGDKYDEYTDNPFIETSEQNVSTFSVDADGASYANMRRFITDGSLPYANSVRIEEFLNYFTFNYKEPADDHSVAINGEIGSCPWNAEHKLIRLGIKGKSVSEAEAPDANFVFLVDVSGSMDSDDKIELLKSGLKMLVDYMRPTDRISLITYASGVEKVLPSTPAGESEVIKKAISQLTARGSTAGAAAMEMAYAEAEANYIEGGNNRVIMGTDGDFNVGVTSTDALVEMVENNADKGIYLTVCGFGRGNLNDSMIEKITNSGNGTYEYIDCEDELTKVFINERSEFVSVANDAKIQVTFSPELVKSYRLIGYENRILSQEDFENDKKDAGEIGAGQTITALYEVVPVDDYVSGKSLARFDFRYKKALGEDSIPLSCDVVDEENREDVLSEDFCFAAGVAAYGMILRNSPYKGSATYDLAKELIEVGSQSYDPHGYRHQLIELIDKAKGLK